MPTLGFGELVVILILTILVFGAVRLPKIGGDLGKMMQNFKRGLDHEDKIQVKRELASSDIAERKKGEDCVK